MTGGTCQRAILLIKLDFYLHMRFLENNSSWQALSTNAFVTIGSDLMRKY